MDFATSVTVIGWFVQVLFDKSLTAALKYWGAAANNPELHAALESLRTALNGVRALLPIAAMFRGDNEGLLELLKDLKNAAYDAEDLLSELDYYGLQQVVEGDQNSNNRSLVQSSVEAAGDLISQVLKLKNDDNQASTSSPPTSCVDSITTIIPRMDAVVGRLNRLTTSVNSILSLLKPEEDLQQNQHVYPVASHRVTTSFLSSRQSLFGRIDERDHIIELLMTPATASVCVLPIVGMGGVGKTTLARMVYNDKRVKDHFDTLIWVCVSDNFDVIRLTKEMLQYLGVDGFDRVTNLNRLQLILMEKLWPQKFLLVLDDVWNLVEKDKWNLLCAPLESGKVGSRVLMTTRLGPVASLAGEMMHLLGGRPIELKGLPPKEFLPLFDEWAFGDEDPSRHPGLAWIGRQIADKLKGSPLAAKTVGSLLRQNLDEEHWRSVLRSDIWQLPQNLEDIMPVLKLSYQHLPGHLQQCFAFCSVFPKDWEFQKNKLVAMWISHGYIHIKATAQKTQEDIGSEYFDNLLSRSFFETSERFPDKIRYVIHDLLHDVAESVSPDDSFRSTGYNLSDIPRNVRHLLAQPSDLVTLKQNNLSSLRTLIILSNTELEAEDYAALQELLEGLKTIRMLYFVSTLERIPENIGHLIHLRYMVIERSSWPDTILPGDLYKLYHIQWLGCPWFPSIPLENETIPVGMTNLVRLRNFFGTPRNFGMLNGIGKLTCLQGLESFAVGKDDGRKIGELKKLKDLGGSLQLLHLENVTTKEEAIDAELYKKVHVKKLELQCSMPHDSPEIAEEVFEALQPPPNIKQLTVNNYGGVKSPTWMMAQNLCLCYLQSLTLLSCFLLGDLPPLGQFALLKHLVIQGAHTVKQIGSTFYGTGKIRGFPCLETLEFDRMPEWVEWSGNEGDRYSLFPNLRVLMIKDCPKLTKVPMHELKSLQELQIWSCSNLMSSLEELDIFSSLKTLIIDCAHEIQSLPLLPMSLLQLTISNCNEMLTLFNTDTLSKLTSLQELTIQCCSRFMFVPADLTCLLSLKKLVIANCDKIKKLPLLPVTLKELEVKGLKLLTVFTMEKDKKLTSLASLQVLSIQNCLVLQFLPRLPASVQKLYVQDCPALPREMYMQEGEAGWHNISHIRNITWPS